MNDKPSEIIDFDTRRRQESDLARDQGVIECLKETIRRIESGEIPHPTSVYVAMMCRTETGGMTRASASGGIGSQLESAGLLSWHLNWHWEEE